MRKMILLIMLISIHFFTVKGQEQASIDFDFSKVEKNIEPNVYTGAFFEYLGNNVNHKLGVGAQELMDRGMDADRFNNQTAYWKNYFTCDSLKCKVEYPWYLGYNLENGIIHYIMRKNTPEGFAGFSQNIMIDNDSDYEFYCYLKGYAGKGFVYISLLDTLTGELLYRGELGPINDNWQKYSVDIPKIESRNNVTLTITISEEGHFEVDETSFKSKSSKYNLRKSFVDLMKYAKPGSLRFPGGVFADHIDTHLKYNLEDVDKRKSPHYSYGAISERMDFGYNEYFEFCRDLKIEPYIVVNYKYGTPEEAAEFVSYCNDPYDKGMGKVRAEKGYLTPFNVKFWEVGNEIWENDTLLAKRFLEYYKAMKKVDPTIKIMIPGNHWTLVSNIRTLFSKIQDTCDIYSWHPCCNGYWLEGVPPEEYVYEVFASWGFGLHWDIKHIQDLIKQYSGSDRVKHAPTEWWTSYEGFPYWLEDRMVENSNLVTAMASIQMIHECVKNWEHTSLACRTLFLGYLRNRINSKNQRVAYGCGTFYSLSMFSNHHGDDYLPINVISNSFRMMEVKGFWPQYGDVPYIDAVSTMSDDSIYVSIVNRHKTSKIETSFNIKGWEKTKEVMVYELASESYKDANTADDPLKLLPKAKKMLLQSGSYAVEPHSYTIVAIPRNDIHVDVKYEARPDFDLQLFPNPASNYIIIDTYGKIMDKIEIYSPDGALVKALRADELAAGYYELDLSQFAAGVYLIKAEQNGMVIDDKFTVRK